MVDYNDGWRRNSAQWDDKANEGMTLRDWFAGQALAGYFAYKWADHQNAATTHTANYIYQMADAMIAARENQNG